MSIRVAVVGKLVYLCGRKEVRRRLVKCLANAFGPEESTPHQAMHTPEIYDLIVAERRARSRVDVVYNVDRSRLTAAVSGEVPCPAKKNEVVARMQTQVELDFLHGEGWLQFGPSCEVDLLPEKRKIIRNGGHTGYLRTGGSISTSMTVTIPTGIKYEAEFLGRTTAKHLS